MILCKGLVQTFPFVTKKNHQKSQHVGKYHIEVFTKLIMWGDKGDKWYFVVVFFRDGGESGSGVEYQAWKVTENYLYFHNFKWSTKYYPRKCKWSKVFLGKEGGGNSKKWSKLELNMAVLFKQFFNVIFTKWD